MPLPWLVVMHACDNLPCCNPAHLELKERYKNNEDKVAKGRQARGESVGSAKLNPVKVKGIQALHQPGSRDRTALAKEFGVSRGTVARVIRGEGRRCAYWVAAPLARGHRLGRQELGDAVATPRLT